MNEEESDNSEGPVSRKARGRKREPDDKYLEKAQQKIDEIRAKLRTAKKDNMPVKERMRLRNLISAQSSRIRKKQEVIFLNNVTREKDSNFLSLLDILVNNLSGEELVKIFKLVAKTWNLPSGIHVPQPTTLKMEMTRSLSSSPSINVDQALRNWTPK